MSSMKPWAVPSSSNACQTSPPSGPGPGSTASTRAEGAVPENSSSTRLPSSPSPGHHKNHVHQSLDLDSTGIATLENIRSCFRGSFVATSDGGLVEDRCFNFASRSRLRERHLP